MNDLDIRQMVLKIVNKAMEKTENTKAVVIVEYLGFVNLLKVRYYKNGFRATADFDFYKDIDLIPNEWTSKEEIINQLQNAYLEISSLNIG